MFSRFQWVPSIYWYKTVHLNQSQNIEYILQLAMTNYYNYWLVDILGCLVDELMMVHQPYNYWYSQVHQLGHVSVRIKLGQADCLYNSMSQK